MTCGFDSHQKQNVITLLQVMRVNLNQLIQSFLMGFIVGNIFGSLLPIFRVLEGSNIMVIGVLIIYIELMTHSYYSKKFQQTQTYTSIYFSFTIGILISFFIDSYKVGS